MNPALTIDIDFLRLEFAKRLRVLIGNEDRTKNLENFSDKSGISLRQLSQWQNPRHINWPSVPTVIQLMVAARISANWLLLGVGPQVLNMAPDLEASTLAGGLIIHAHEKVQRQKGRGLQASASDVKEGQSRAKKRGTGHIS